jgi:hypothetical protein
MTTPGTQGEVSPESNEENSIFSRREPPRRETGLSPHYWNHAEHNRLKPCRGEPFDLWKEFKFESQKRKFPLKGHRSDEIDCLVRRNSGSFGDRWIGGPCIYNPGNQGCCKIRRRQNPEHGAVNARGASGPERWGTCLRRHTHWSRRLCKAMSVKNRMRFKKPLSKGL